jgi:voltage-gated potassium channel
LIHEADLFEPEAPVGSTWRGRWFDVVFGHDTTAGRIFDVTLILAIFMSVGVAVADSVPDLHAAHGRWFLVAEWSSPAFLRQNTSSAFSS